MEGKSTAAAAGTRKCFFYLTQKEVDAALQLIQLGSSDSRHSRTNDDREYHTADQTSQREAASHGDSTFVDVSSSPTVMEKKKKIDIFQRRQDQDKSLGQTTTTFQRGSVNKFAGGRSRRSFQNRKQPAETNIVRQSKAKEEEEESKSNISHVHSASSSCTETTQLRRQMIQPISDGGNSDIKRATEERRSDKRGKRVAAGEEEEGSKSSTSDLSTEGFFKAAILLRETSCLRKRKFRCVTDVYRETKAF